MNASPSHEHDPRSEPLSKLLAELGRRGYRFITPTPATHGRVIARPSKRRAEDLRDVFGWNLPFAPSLLEPELAGLAREAEALEPTPDGLCKSRYRVSSLGELLFLHSGYPTDEQDAVFFGPDSYRFARFIQERLAPTADTPRIVDIGAGAGVGGVVAGRMLPGAELVLTDVNAEALRLARINAAHAGVEVALREAEGLAGIEGAFDAVLINPPYIIDPSGRAYRDGGGLHGARLALDLSLEALDRLAPGGSLLLYTGAPIVDGRDELRHALKPETERRGLSLDYRERDPDVFGEELEKSEYAEVERIAVVEVVVTRQG